MAASEKIAEIRNSIVKTIKYADLYDYPLKPGEIYSDLQCDGVSEEEFQSALSELNGVNGPIGRDGDFCFVRGRESLVGVRKIRQRQSSELVEKYHGNLMYIARLPFVRTVILTGSIAFDNAVENDDLDLMLITSPNRAWIVDLYNLCIVRILHEKILKRSRGICINYVVDQAKLTVPERDFFTAHQLTHMKPVYDEGVLESYIESNSWIRGYFPNCGLIRIEPSVVPAFKRRLEKILTVCGIGILNILFYLFRGRRLIRKKKDGLIRGDFSLRRIKSNDSRLGSIVDLRMKFSTSLADSMDSLFSEILINPDNSAKSNGIPDFIPEAVKESIDPFLEYYCKTRERENLPLPDEKILRLPHMDRCDDPAKIWKRRSVTSARVLGILRFLLPGSTGPILDSGAGNCWFSSKLIGNGYLTISLDPLLHGDWGMGKGTLFERDSWIKLARIRGIMEKLPFKNKTFKAVIANGSFHYSCDPAGVIRESMRVLDNRGFLVICDSPVFKDNRSGSLMIKEISGKYDPQGILKNLNYKPRWFIDLSEIRRIADEENLVLRVIHTRSFSQKLADRIKNIFTSRRKWAEFPILVISQNETGLENTKQSIPETLRYWHYKCFIEPKLAGDKVFRIDSLNLKVNNNVFHPLPFDSSRILLDVIKRRYPDLSGRKVLDMGTGSGIHAIACAQAGALVTAVDINPDAVTCADQNASINSVRDKITFVNCDLFDGINKAGFDLVIFNPPYYSKAPVDMIDKAWFDRDNRVLKQFIGEIAEFLNQDGEVLLILSSRMNLDAFQDHVKGAGLSLQVIQRRRVWDEVYHVFSLRRFPVT
jgi:release factor glutamine methyltransferase